MIAATVGDEAITVADVDRRLTTLYEGPLAPRLPHPGSPEGRNLRRWLVQLMTMERVVAQECDLDGDPVPVTLPVALRTGGVVAAVLATPAGRALFARVEADVPPEEVRGYYDRNRDRHPGRFEEESPRIEAQLVQARRETLFARWLEGRHREKVTLMPGFEHPGDPRQPDATHRH
ncbi:malonyl CoA-ACP transacylase [Herbidospora galbida]|uniref:Malonyl CoA-ACP transacylase n=1 Tax=Herbidospora galbida TaxID=2575442 RepID=A0A4U3M8Z4_9ACTN|nr:malonyl CoA-ACP transacylase [Herbidospora galbida]TKK84504.1 malonyl CoA-ACP transacylase [Herbidospora galbida]